MTVLDGVRRRLDHAQTRMDALEDNVRVFLEGHPFRLVPEHEPDQQRYVWRAKYDQPIPATWGLIVGDAIHNLRAALDNLFWSLASLDNKTPPNSAMFPVHRNKTGKGSWQTSGSQMVKAVPGRFRGLISDLQPCHSHTVNPEDSRLWILNRLWNDDKHRATHVVGLNTTGTEIAISGPLTLDGFSGPFIHYGAFDDGDVLAWFFTRSVDVDIDANFDVQTALNVAFDQSGPMKGRSLIDGLIELHDFVRNDVVNKFEALL